MWETLRSIDTPRFSVRIEITPDTDADFSFDETGETLQKINSGEWSCFGARATVTHRETGISLGEGSIWGCIYSDVSDFLKDGYCRDIVNEAIFSARQALQALQTR